MVVLPKSNVLFTPEIEPPSSDQTRENDSRKACAGTIVIMTHTKSCDDEPKLLYLESILQESKFFENLNVVLEFFNFVIFSSTFQSLKNLHSSQLIVSSEKSNFFISLNFKFFA